MSGMRREGAKVVQVMQIVPVVSFDKDWQNISSLSLRSAMLAEPN